MRPWRFVGPLLVSAAAAGVIGTSAVPQGRAPSPEARLAAVRDQIVRLRADLRTLESRESGILGGLDRIDAVLRLRRAELDEVSLRLDGTREAVKERQASLDSLAGRQNQRRRWLSFRLREMYKRGPSRGAQQIALRDDGPGMTRALRYAAVLSERDARVLASFRDDAVRLRQEKGALSEEEARLSALRDESAAAAGTLVRAEAEQRSILETLRSDRSRRQRAIEELEAAAGELTRLAAGGEGGGTVPSMDVHALRGLLDWPSEGRLGTGFGKAVHPRFATVVPHNGIDIEVAVGTPFRSVFDGRVIYAAVLQGYGLTAIVDHGRGVVSVYTGASALFAEAGQEVLRGDVLGSVGPSGAGGGPGLYFEIRENGRAVDPVPWLRRR